MPDLEVGSETNLEDDTDILDAVGPNGEMDAIAEGLVPEAVRAVEIGDLLKKVDAPMELA